MSTYTVDVFPVQLEKHPNADRLSIVRFEGWQVCTESSQWREGDFGAYIPPDSLVPVDRPEFAFLLKDAKNYGEKKMARIKAKKLRGVVSFGLLIPAPPGSKPGDNVMEALGVEHYDPEVKIPNGKGGEKLVLGGETESAPNLPFSFSKYDLENLRRYPFIFREGEEVVVTEKLDGSNCRLVWWEGKQYVGSRTEWKREYPSFDHLTEDGLIQQLMKVRNAGEREKLVETPFEEIEKKAREILERVHSKPKSQNTFWMAFRRAEETWGKFCRDNPGVVVFGEVFGNAGRVKYAPTNTFRAFDLFRQGQWVDPFEARDVLGDVGEDGWAPFIGKVPFSLERIGELTEGPSLLGPAIREGVVIGPLQERWHEKVGRVKAKSVSAAYLEKY